MTRGYKRSKEGDRKLQEVTGGYKGLQMVTRGYN